ncbi:hypothetical protein EON64_12225 [archaeon]|nr:MAG: hypothetical protein EON64_12225 [archaeon]
MKQLWLTLLLLWLLSLLSTHHAFQHMQYLRERFNSTFHHQCSKYPFVQKYYDLLDMPGKKYVDFVFQEGRLRNGGLGDRLAGMVTAMEFALRFDRILLVRSSTGFGELFEPYHGYGGSRPHVRYSYENWTSWTQYDTHWHDHDETEYDLFDCINTTGLKNAHCSMQGGDVAVPVILYRGNRIYLCRDYGDRSLPSHADLVRLVGEQHMASLDLFQVAGCMLRLALWPTDLLWQRAEQVYDQLSRHIPALHQPPAPARRLSTQRDRASLFQVGMHFRCGDGAYLKGGGARDQGCLLDASSPPQQQRGGSAYNPYMDCGTPAEISRCAAQLLTNQSLASPSKRQTALTFSASDSLLAAQHMSDLIPPQLAIGALTSPPGCHIELTATLACLAETAAYWLVLSLSDAIVMPMQGEAGQASSNSAFSRMASIYSLHRDAAFDPHNCGHPTPTRLMALRQNGNWFC